MNDFLKKLLISLVFVGVFFALFLVTADNHKSYEYTQEPIGVSGTLYLIEGTSVFLDSPAHKERSVVVKDADTYYAIKLGYLDSVKINEKTYKGNEFWKELESALYFETDEMQDKKTVFTMRDIDMPLIVEKTTDNEVYLEPLILYEKDNEFIKELIENKDKIEVLTKRQNVYTYQKDPMGTYREKITSK